MFIDGFFGKRLYAISPATRFVAKLSTERCLVCSIWHIFLYRTHVILLFFFVEKFVKRFEKTESQMQNLSIFRKIDKNQCKIFIILQENDNFTCKIFIILAENNNFTCEILLIHAEKDHFTCEIKQFHAEKDYFTCEIKQFHAEKVYFTCETK